MAARYTFVVFVTVAFAWGGCGDDGPSGAADAAIGGDGATTDVPATDAAMVTCGYTEQADLTNDSNAGAETTNLTLATSLVLCGALDTGHFVQGVVDNDRFKFSTTATTDVLMHVTGAGAEALDDVIIQIGSPTGTSLGFGVFEGDHGTLHARLPPGEWRAAITAFHGTAATAAIPYQLKIVTDMPATRCATQTAAADFTETNDGGANNGNDVIEYDSAANPTTSLTLSPLDAPEPTGVTATTGRRYRISGSSANVNPADDYMDRDTFAFATDATTNQLSVRLNWPSTTVDFDYRIYPENMTTSVAAGLRGTSMEDEFQTFAVKPNTTYWLWIAAFDGSTGQPAAYDATVCAETFAP